MSAITIILLLFAAFLFVMFICFFNVKRLKESAHEECYHTSLDCENCQFSSRCSSISNPEMLITVKEGQNDG